MDQRVKGQDVEMLVVLNNVIQDTLTTVKDIEIAINLETLEEEYLGESTPRFDDIYKGVSGKSTHHFSDQGVLNVFRSIVDRAKRREPGTKINLKATLNMPNGQRPRIIIPDLFFGNIPISFGGRQEYGTFPLEWKASDFSVIGG